MKKIFVLFVLLFLSLGNLFAKEYYGKEDNGNIYLVRFDVGDVSDIDFQRYCLKHYKYFVDGFLSKEDTEDIFGSDLKFLIEKYDYILYFSFDEEGNTTSTTFLRKTTEEPDAYRMIQGRNTILEVEYGTR